jgi:hypothetical protein
VSSGHTADNTPSTLNLFESDDALHWTFVKTIASRPPVDTKGRHNGYNGYHYISIVDKDGSDNAVVGGLFYVYGTIFSDAPTRPIVRWPVRVDDLSPTVSITADPTSVTSGGSSTLTWSSTNATSCTASGGWSGARGVNGSQVITNITQTQTYTLTCTGAGGSVDTSATVTVHGVMTACDSAVGGKVDVRLFGAVGNGIVDDTASLKAAMQCLKQKLDSGVSAMLYFPPGTYKISDALQLQQTTGTSWQSVAIRGEGSSMSVLVTPAAKGVLDLRFTQQVPLTIEDLRIVADVAHAGSGIKITMPPQNTGLRSLVLHNVHINGMENSNAKYFDIDVEGNGISHPYLKEVNMRGIYVGTGFAGITSVGTACVVFTNVYGFEADNTYCTNMKSGYDISSLGGDITIESQHALGVVADMGLRIQAGGGKVLINGAHMNAGTWNYDIDRAGSLVLQNTLTLNQDRNGVQAGHGVIRVTNSSNVTIKDNMFMQSGPTCPPPSGSPWVCYNENTSRTSVYIGSGNNNVRVTGNLFDEPGTGIYIAMGTVGAVVDSNRFFRSAVDIDNREPSSIISRLPAEQ